MKSLSSFIFVILSFCSALSFASQQQNDAYDSSPSNIPTVTAPDKSIPDGQYLPSCDRSVSCDQYPSGGFYLKTQVCDMPVSARVVEGAEWELGCPKEVVSEGQPAQLEAFSKKHCRYKSVDKSVTFTCYYTYTDGKDIR